MKEETTMTDTETTPMLPRTAVLFSGSIATGKALTNLTEFIVDFMRINARNNRALLLRLNSSGGVPEQVFALCGLLRQVQAQKHKVIVHVLGQLSNFTMLLALIADEVWMEPSASFSFEQMDVFTSGPIRNMESYIQFQFDMFETLVQEMVSRSSKKASGNQLDESTVRSWKARHITAQQAAEWGLCDTVLPWPEPVKKSDLPTKTMRYNGNFSTDDALAEDLIWLHNFMEDKAYRDVPLLLDITSWGGTVIPAVSLYGLLLQAQREGHHLTIYGLGQMYSCSLWFLTVALNSGDLFIDKMAFGMYHAPQSQVSGRLDHLAERLAVQKAVFAGTRALLMRAPGFTHEVLDRWETEPDTYLSGAKLVSYGLGKLV
jgi:ATP-dependent protease ClpP protease subunit